MSIWAFWQRHTIPLLISLCYLNDNFTLVTLSNPVCLEVALYKRVCALEMFPFTAEWVPKFKLFTYNKGHYTLRKESTSTRLLLYSLSTPLARNKAAMGKDVSEALVVPSRVGNGDPGCSQSTCYAGDNMCTCIIAPNTILVPRRKQPVRNMCPWKCSL